MTAIQVTEWKRRKRAEGYCAESCGRKALFGYSRCDECRQKHNHREHDKRLHMMLLRDLELESCRPSPYFRSVK